MNKNYFNSNIEHFGGILGKGAEAKCELECGNNGKLVGKGPDCKCKCNSGFKGKKCQINIDDCAKKPCVNGRCKDQVNGYKCICDPGYEGVDCDKKIDCSDVVDKCENGEIVGNSTKETCRCNVQSDGEEMIVILHYHVH